MTREERFWAKVNKDGENGCWVWKGCSVGGYGSFHWERRPQRAHRISWRLANGEIPDGLFVCHRCNNPPCVNPEHLYLGTSRQNTLDAIRDGLWYQHKRPNTHCLRCGGEFTLNNRGHRQCVNCRKADHRVWIKQRQAETTAFLHAVKKIKDDPIVLEAVEQLAYSSATECQVARNALLEIISLSPSEDSTP